MKRNLLKISIIAIVVGVVAIVASCQKDNDTSGPVVSGIHNSECGEHLDASGAKFLDENEGYVVSVDSGIVNVLHVNWMVPCDYHNITVAISLQGSVVNVNECCSGGAANCICQIDNVYNISDLPSGTYTIFFSVCSEFKYSAQVTI